MQEFDALVVGAGPAGLTAAATAARAGASVLLVDENLHPGGQYYRSLPSTFLQSARWMQGAVSSRNRLVDEALGCGVRFLTEASVFAIEPGYRVAVHLRSSREARWMHARCVVVAAGAHEFVMPFPGWTLPGVMTLGGAQNLYKSQGLAPGANVVMAGTGPFLWLVAQQLIRAGVRPSAVVEATPLRASAAFALRAWAYPRLALEAAGYWARILSKTSLRFGYAVVKAEGDQHLERLTIAKIDSAWQTVPGSSITIAADALCISHGLVPTTELTRLVGCEHWADSSGALVPVVGRLLETSSQGLFAAGETLGIGGEPVAELEGRVAGTGVAFRLGLMTEATALSTTSSHRAQAVRRRRLVRTMVSTYSPRRGALAWALDDTVVCRCEEVTAAMIRRSLSLGDTHTDLVKSRTRCGMGSCQGRVCGPVIQRMLVPLKNADAVLPAPFAVRPPIKPVPVKDLVDSLSRPSDPAASL